MVKGIVNALVNANSGGDSSGDKIFVTNNTGVKFKDLVFPGVKEAFEMCKEAALVVPEVRYVGWDVVLTEDGPLILEGNEYPSYGLIQYYLFNDEREGHLATISKILGDEMKKIDL